jgi:hypothetical protein
VTIFFGPPVTTALDLDVERLHLHPLDVGLVLGGDVEAAFRVGALEVVLVVLVGVLDLDDVDHRAVGQLGARIFLRPRW